MVVGIIQIIVALAAIMVAILIALLGFNYWQNRRLEAYYKVIWKKASALQPREVLDEPGSAIDPIGATQQICTNPADKQTERSITGRFG